MAVDGDMAILNRVQRIATRVDGFSDTVTDTIDLSSLYNPNYGRDCSFDPTGSYVFTYYDDVADEGKNAKMVGFTETLREVITLPANGAVGCSYTGASLLSGDVNASEFYVHIGYTEFIDDTVSSPKDAVVGLAFNSLPPLHLGEYYSGYNEGNGGVSHYTGLIWVDEITNGGLDLIMKGLTHDGTNIIFHYVIGTTYKIVRKVGFTQTSDKIIDTPTPTLNRQYGVTMFVEKVDRGTRRQRSIKALTRSRNRRNKRRRH